jgi:hypothetical protein
MLRENAGKSIRENFYFPHKAMERGIVFFNDESPTENALRSVRIESEIAMIRVDMKFVATE